MEFVSKVRPIRKDDVTLDPKTPNVSPKDRKRKVSEEKLTTRVEAHFDKSLEDSLFNKPTPYSESDSDEDQREEEEEEEEEAKAKAGPNIEYDARMGNGFIVFPEVQNEFEEREAVEVLLANGLPEKDAKNLKPSAIKKLKQTKINLIKKHDAYIERKSQPMIEYVDEVLARSNTRDLVWEREQANRDNLMEMEMSGVIKASPKVNTFTNKALAVIHVRHPHLKNTTKENYIYSRVHEVRDMFISLVCELIMAGQTGVKQQFEKSIQQISFRADECATLLGNYVWSTTNQDFESISPSAIRSIVFNQFTRTTEGTKRPIFALSESI